MFNGKRETNIHYRSDKPHYKTSTNQLN